VPFVLRPILLCASVLFVSFPLSCFSVDASPGDSLTREGRDPEFAAQPLSQALAEFARRTGLQLIYVSQLTVDRRSHPVPAGLSPAAALNQLLEGTGLDFTFLNGRTIRIFARPHGPRQPAVVRTDADPVANNALEEVVITATKREEPLSLVPMSIGVLSADDLQAQHIRTISDIAERTPGLLFDFNSQYGPALITNIAIRGISASSGAPLTGIYIDDVPIQASLNVFRNAYPVTFDLDRVEVLRGPQGALFGSNAPAGAVRFIPNEPSTTQFSQSYHFEISGSQNGGAGEEAGAAVGGPVIEDRLGARVSGWYRRDGGYIDHVDPLNNASVDSNDNRSLSKAARLGFVVQPTESLRVVPSLYYQSVYRHDSPVFYTYLSDPTEDVLANGKLLRQPTTDTFTLGSLKVDENLGNFDLTGVTGYFDRHSDAITDLTNGACLAYFGGCGNPLGPAYPSSYAQAVPTVLNQHQTAFTQELRLAYADPGAWLTGLAGVFYSRSHQNGIQDTYAILDPTNPGIYSNTRFAGTEVSVFGQLRLALSERWHVDLGTRQGWSRGSSASFQSGFANTGPRGFAQSVGKFAALPGEPRFDLAFQPDANGLLYVEVAKGARQGGENNPASCDGISVPDMYTPDSIWNYELGAKELLFNRRLELAASLYFIHWDGIQEDVSDVCGNGYTANAGLGSSKGFDLTLQALLSEHLRLNLALGLTDARYDRTVHTGGGQIVVDRGTAIGALPSVPSPWSGTLSLDYRRPLTATLGGYFDADDSFTTRNAGPFTENDPNALSYSPGFRSDPSTNRLNIHLGVTRSRVDVGLLLENALNSLPTLRANSDNTGSSLYYAYTFRPRTIGLTVNWKP
jgi:iron complex outermembrane recepter protein